VAAATSSGARDASGENEIDEETSSRLLSPPPTTSVSVATSPMVFQSPPTLKTSGTPGGGGGYGHTARGRFGSPASTSKMSPLNPGAVKAARAEADSLRLKIRTMESSLSESESTLLVKLERAVAAEAGGC